MVAGKELKGRSRRKRKEKGREGEERVSEMRLRLSGRESGETPRKERCPNSSACNNSGPRHWKSDYVLVRRSSILSNSSSYPSPSGQQPFKQRQNQRKIIDSTGRPHYNYY